MRLRKLFIFIALIAVAIHLLIHTTVWMHWEGPLSDSHYCGLHISVQWNYTPDKRSKVFYHDFDLSFLKQTEDAPR